MTEPRPIAAKKKSVLKEFWWNYQPIIMGIVILGVSLLAVVGVMALKAMIFSVVFKGVWQ